MGNRGSRHRRNSSVSTARDSNIPARLSGVNAFQAAQARAHAQHQAAEWRQRHDAACSHNQPRRQVVETSPQVVHCVRCRRALMPPANHPRFRCPCGQIMANPFMVNAQRVRCPRCAGILAPVPGLTRFRCPCGALLTLPSGDLWKCNMCQHMNPAHRAGCEMCGEGRYSSSDSEKTKEEDEKYVRERSRLVSQGQQVWIRRMDSTFS